MFQRGTEKGMWLGFACLPSSRRLFKPTVSLLTGNISSLQETTLAVLVEGNCHVTGGSRRAEEKA